MHVGVVLHLEHYLSPSCHSCYECAVHICEGNTYKGAFTLGAAAGEGAEAVLQISAWEQSLQGLSDPVELGLHQEANPNLSYSYRGVGVWLGPF